MNIAVILKELNKLSNKAYKKGEVPVACIITYNNKIVAKAYNKRIKTNNPLKHAEIIAIIKATKKIKNWRLNNCNMYVTLEPCHMCKEIIKESRINKVFYIVKKDKVVNYKTTFEQLQNIDSYDYSYLLTSFFKELR